MIPKKYVVGNGISALSFAFYNPDYTVISEKEKKDSPFVFIQENKYTIKLMQDLNIEFDTEIVKIIPLTDADRIIESKGIDATRSFKGTDRIANVGKNLLLLALNITESQVCSKISEIVKDRIIVDKITKITRNNIHLKNSNSALEYSEIIYTEHFDKFQNLYTSWECGEEIKLHDLIFVKNEYNSSLGSFIKYEKDGMYCKSVNNAINKTAGYEIRADTTAPENSITIKGARFSGRLAPPPEKILFVGRSATANPHWRIEDSLFIAQEGYGLCKMLYEQNRFDYQLQKAKNINGHERISGLILHAHSELGELLREINWKMNSNHNRISKATSVLEEGIDVIKLIWAIFYHFQYTPREINDMFWDKSSRMWDRLLTEFYGGL